MKYRIEHEIRGRIRITGQKNQFSFKEADRVCIYFERIKFITKVKVYEKTGSIAICYEESSREALLEVIGNLDFQKLKEEIQETHTGRELNCYYKEQIVGMVVKRTVCKFVFSFPLFAPAGQIITICRAARFIWNGLKCLAKGKLDVAVLDAAAIGTSVLRNDYGTAGSVMFLLNLGELLEEWTHKKSVFDLARSLSVQVDQVWLAGEEAEVLVPLSSVKKGDKIKVRMGSVIPTDGVVVEGEGMVNQSSLTGESIGVRKSEGAQVYAGTVLEEGELTVCISSVGAETRFEKIVSMIEDSEKLKSSLESKASRLADSLVPYSLGGTILTYLLTRNVTKAISVLMVDFSCALKLSMPLAVLSAMRECGDHKIVVKGGKFLEAVAEADTIVFDKTGTLTKAEPTVAQIYTFKDYKREEILRLAACLEEHFPHSIANAVVRQAEKESLNHDEMHSKVEYVVAHGIASYVGEKRVLIGSHHFIFEDEKVIVPEGGHKIISELPAQYSFLYLAIGGELAAVICIEDPLREEVTTVLPKLRALGIQHMVMLTGDSERTAKVIAGKLEIDDYRSEVLPEDKAEYIEMLKKQGKKVIMIGDGINDSPALSAASVGIAVSEGAQIAREIADITISADDLNSLVTLKELSNQLLKRINKNYRFVISFNTGLIGMGLLGIITPGTSALLHNLSTVAVSLENMTNLKK